MEDVLNVWGEIEDEEKKQHLSIPAKRLREKLLPLKSKEERTAKRWFWELLQNASDYNQKVDIRLEVDNDRVTFSHNGCPFSIQDVLNLISPDSGKDNDEIKKDNIGKFGSGLVSTHILSSEIEVNGAFKSENENQLYRFNFKLDRSCFENKTELIKSIEKSKNEFRNSALSIQQSEYEGFMTSFTYNLNKKLPGLSSSFDVVESGLKHIYEVLPYTLCFMSKVHSVNIFDNREKASFKHYLIERRPESDGIIKYKIVNDTNIKETAFHRIKFAQVETVYRQENGAVIPFPSNISKLFCGLPLIGSEDIGLPLLINSLDFEPTLEREGVEITVNDKENLALFKQAIELYKHLLNDVASKQLDNAFHLTNLSSSFNGIEGSKNMYKRDFVPGFQKTIETSKIVRNAKGNFICLSELLLPHKKGEPYPELYESTVEIKSTRLPNKDSYTGWLHSTSFVLFPKQKYDLIQFVSEVSQTTQIQAFVLSSGKDVLEWLRQISKLVSKDDQALFSSYPILPNQKGGLRIKNDLSRDLDIPEELKSIYNNLNSEEIETSLLEKSFNEFSNIVDKTTDIINICQKIDACLKEKYAADKASTSSFSAPLNKLFRWLNSVEKTKKELEELFAWFYPRRATLFMDSFGESERDYAFTIVRSGKMKALATLAEANITPEELEYIGKNPKIISLFYAFLQDKIDDDKFANSETGFAGEKLVFNDLRQKFKPTDGYNVIWSSKNGESRFDFEVTFRGKTALYVDAKTTIRGVSNNESVPFFIRNSQWEFFPRVGPEVKYLIARVFKGEEIIKYLQVNLFFQDELS